MPSGRTHDRITVWTLPLLAAGVLIATKSSRHALLAAGAYLFGGLMLSPDLDIHSRPYKRWGPLRWIWLPYRRAMHHRSMLSHGPIVGTVFRLLYLLSWALLFWVIWVVAVAQLLEPRNWWSLSLTQLDNSLQELLSVTSAYPAEAVTLFLGLELGGMSHSLSDWSVSHWKRWHKHKRGSKGKRQKKR